MARDSSGSYTLPAGSTVASGDVIESTWANALTADLAGEITNSLDRSGRGAMSGTLKLPDGTAAAPALAFTSNSNLGFYRAGAGDMRAVVGGSEVARFLSSGAYVTGVLQATGVATFGAGLAAGNTTTGTLGVSGNITASGTIAATGGFTGLTRASLGAVGQQVSSACGSFSTTSATPVDVTNLSVTITTTGRPVMLMVESGTTGGSISAAAGFATTPSIAFVRGSTTIAVSTYPSHDTAFPFPPPFLDVVAAGTYTYKVQASKSAGSAVYITDLKLVAFEL
jgi:hypothetical protein